MRQSYYKKIDKKKFFYPDEWLKFYNSIDDKKQAYFKIAINTGARVDEIRNLKIRHLDLPRMGLTFYKTKRKRMKGMNPITPEPRTIKISSQFKTWLQSRIKEYKLKPDDTFDVKTTVAIDRFIKRRLKKLDFEYYNDYSSHNIRKTFITYLRHWKVDSAVLAAHTGHDVRTANRFYAKNNLMNELDALTIRNKILGDLVDTLKTDWKIKSMGEISKEAEL